MDSSDDDDSAKSIPRPIYEATSAIDSPPPHLVTSAGHEMEVSTCSTLSNKRLKYVVSSPPGSANGNSSSSSGAWPASATTTAGGHASLTMKLTKVTPTATPAATAQQTIEAKPAGTSTPKPGRQEQGNKVRVPKEMIALQRSHNESKVLTGYVSDSAKLKRRKSGALAAQLIKQTVTGGLSTTLPHSGATASRSKVSLKRSKSIPAPVLDSDTEWMQEPELGLGLGLPLGSKSPRKRNFSMAYDEPAYAGDELSADGEESNSNPARRLSQRFRSRSKTVSLSSEERQPRRGNMRSENEDFARKHHAFLDRVINDTMDSAPSRHTELEADRVEWRSSSLADTDPNVSVYSDASESKTLPSSANATEKTEQRLSAVWRAPLRDGWDPFCWKCRECDKVMPCSKCLRSFHTFCVRPASTKFDASWKCPECVLVESAPKRPRRNDVSVDLLSQLLSYALERMKHVRGVYKLRAPQDVLPETYRKYFVNPVNFDTLAERIRQRTFHSADEFLGEVKWMQHNALILDSGDVKVEQASKAVVKVCRQEANEIDTCAECYLNANSSDEWFVKVCTHPHLLLWAKLKGFPYWPAKAMGSGPNAVVNVRFFGKHDRANVPVKDCFLYCAQDPNTQTSRRSARDLAECIREVEVHIEHIKEKIGSFHYAPYRTPYDPLEEQQQLEAMMPGVHDVISRQLAPANKTPLQFLIRKTAGDKLSIVKKTKTTTESGNESDQSQCSPAKKPLPDASPPPPPPSDPPKLKSSNYEVIPRAGDALRESRGCTVVLKRKSLESNKAGKALSELLPAKRKHSQSDASSEASSCQLGASEGSTEHRRRSKHAKRLLQEAMTDAQLELEQEQEQEQQQAQQQVQEATAAPAESNPSVVSVVELVRRRQGVTITKIPREQQQQQQLQLQQPAAPVVTTSKTPAAAAAAAPAVVPVPAPAPAPAPLAAAPPSETHVDELVARQRAVERQQQQLISKVVPFVEIKREVQSEPEEAEEQVEQQLAPAAEAEAAPAPVPLPATAPPCPPAPPAAAEPTRTVPTPALLPLKIKEEVVSEEELEMEAVRQPPAPPPPPLPIATAAAAVEEAPAPMPPPAPPAAAAPAAAAPTAAPAQLGDDFVRFVGDTTIQRLSHKQSPKPDSKQRSSLRGVPHGPLPAAALSPPSAPASPAPAPAASPKPAAGRSNASQPGQPQKSPQLRVKSDKSLNANSSPPPNPLKSNMVVIPMEPRVAVAVGVAAATDVVGSSNLGSNLMTIPVPPLRAVSKNTLQSSATITVPLPVPVAHAVPVPAAAPPAFAGNSVAPPPLAGLTGRSSAEPAGQLLANALNGLPSETLISEAREEPLTAGVATALSELILRSGPPKLTARPAGPLQSDGASIYPAQAGPLSTRLKENAHKITDYFISVIEDTLSDLAGGEPSVLQARIACLTLENERLKQHYERRLAETQSSADQLIAEMRKTLEQENKRVISELRQHSTLERMRAVEEAKKKQWCANCMREAQLYCCWNTSYCDYPCQQMHWQRHASSCGQAATLQQSHSQQPPQQQQQQQHQQLPPEPARGKHKAAPNPGQQLSRSTMATAAVAGNKKWPQQQMISLVNPPPPSTELLKLPNNTFLRPVPLPATVVSANNSNNSSNSNINSSSSNHNHNNSSSNSTGGGAGGVGGSYSSLDLSFSLCFSTQLPITVSGNTASFGLISEQHQKQLPKQAGRSNAKSGNNSSSNNSRARNNPNNNSNVQAMRHNQHQHQHQHVFQQ
ncbi:hypothetical protein KR222_005405 [Zaprionus bogoriensis]|nr:hypothetical protein KR222_005405 [Zaprionus bogoriensis]